MNVFENEEPRPIFRSGKEELYVETITWWSMCLYEMPILFQSDVKEKEEELDKILNENNIKILVITESKKEIARNERDWTLYGYLLWNGQAHQRPVRSYDMDPQVNIK